MSKGPSPRMYTSWPRLADMPVHAKALFTAIILTMAVAMMGALGQIMVHDIIPTFLLESEHEGHTGVKAPYAVKTPIERGDLFATQPGEEEKKPFYGDEQFVWTLKWTHIHLFGMNMIFIFMGIMTLFLDLSGRARAWLVVLPFMGILVDIGSVWLRKYVSPAFFWLHIPGGGLFTTVFLVVSCRALYEMWGSRWWRS